MVLPKNSGTLNVLLSFAQFEREVTAERIRDKIAASKRKGMWMDGAVPLGYAVLSIICDRRESGWSSPGWEIRSEERPDGSGCVTQTESW